MINFLAQNWGSILVGLLVVAAAALAVRSLRSNKKKGKLSCSYGCSGGCAGCSAGCGCGPVCTDASANAQDRTPADAASRGDSANALDTENQSRT